MFLLNSYSQNVDKTHALLTKIRIYTRQYYKVLRFDYPKAVLSVGDMRSLGPISAPETCIGPEGRIPNVRINYMEHLNHYM